MEDLGVDELKQLVNFYRQKVSDTEFQLLQLQLKYNKMVVQNTVSQPVPATKVTKKKPE